MTVGNAIRKDVKGPPMVRITGTGNVHAIIEQEKIGGCLQWRVGIFRGKKLEAWRIFKYDGYKRAVKFAKERVGGKNGKGRL